MSQKTRKARSAQKLDLHGRKFTRLFVLSKLRKRGNGGQVLWRCRCKCGTIVVVPAQSLISKNTQSCGCLSRERSAMRIVKVARTHGMSGTPTHSSYKSAKQRCTNPRNNRFHLYGGRGIEFRFTSFEEFFTEVGKRPSLRHSIDRKDPNGHYEPGNVRWATPKVQRANRRDSKQYQTQTLPMAA